MRYSNIRLCYVTQDIFLGRTPVYSESANKNFIIGQRNNAKGGIDFSGVKYGEESFYSERSDKEFLQYGDVLLNTLGGGSVGRIGQWTIKDEHKYITDGHIMILRGNEKINPRYMYYALLSQQKELEDAAVGSTNQAFLTITDIYKRTIPYPLLIEQQRIANFLDCKCADIDNVLDKTRTSIDEYKKLKQAVITEAVTQGIRGARPMRDSGIEWIGSYPEDWTLTKIKWLLHERNERSEGGLEEPLSMSQRYGLIPTKEMDTIPNMASSFIGAKITHIGDLVFNKLKAHLGVFAVSNYNGLVSPDYAVYYKSERADMRYLEYLFKTPQYILEFRKRSSGVGAGLTRLYTSDLFSMHSASPSMQEQQEIASFLDKKCSEIDALITSKEKFITELESYKKVLIYEYVTGKKEVAV